jgi:hypothetical protein
MHSSSTLFIFKACKWWTQGLETAPCLECHRQTPITCLVKRINYDTVQNYGIIYVLVEVLRQTRGCSHQRQALGNS